MFDHRRFQMTSFKGSAAHAATVALPATTIVETRLGPVECVDSGTGPAILALHGGFGGYDQSWFLARAVLGQDAHHRILALSRPGYFGTPLALGHAPEEQADLCAAVLDALDIDTAVVLAVSAGGPGALQFALRHPARCSALALFSACTGRLDVPPGTIARARMLGLLSRVPGLSALMRRRLFSDPDAAARRAVPDRAQRQATLDHPEAGTLLLALMEGMTTSLPRRLPGTLNDIRKLSAMPSIPMESVGVPTLVLHGTADSVVPFSHAEAAATRVPGAILQAIHQGGHACLFSHIEEVRRGTAAFIRDHSGAGPR
jgi:pimeloyl-ACP methyl ester carboxylesterase